MNPFIGTWSDQNQDSITIQEVPGEQAKNFVSVKYTTNGRGPFNGFYINLSSPVIDVNFSDGLEAWVGVLLPAESDLSTGSSDSNTIYWGNGTQWTKTS